MDAISNITVAVGPKLQVPTIKIGGSGGDSTALPELKSTDAPIAQPQPQPQQVNVQEKSVEQKRYEQVRRAAGGIANPYVVSDKRFTIYKDNTGQYITRYVSLRDGKVTYIPEPDLLEMTRRRQVSEAQTSIVI